ERVDGEIGGGRLVAVGRSGRRHGGVEVIDAGGSAVVPGLHDHHIHLAATAAARQSVLVGPPAVTDAVGLAAALRTADADLPPGTWLRAVGYHESVAGDLDRWWLDAVVGGRPVRVQHRSGAAWVLNTAAA